MHYHIYCWIWARRQEYAGEDVGEDAGNMSGFLVFGFIVIVDLSDLDNI